MIGKNYFAAFAVGSPSRPFYALKLQEKVQNVNRVNEVYKSVAHIALSLKVNVSIYFKIHWQIEVIILSLVVNVNHLE